MNSKEKYLTYLSKYNKITKDCYGIDKLKISILRSYTCEQIKEILTVELYDQGYNADIYFGGYNQYFSEILDYNSDFYKFNSDLVILCIRIEELYPEIFNDYENIRNDLKSVKESIFKNIKELIKSIKENSDAIIFFNNFITPMYTYNSLCDFQDEYSQINFIKRLNLEMINVISKFSDVYIVDVDCLAGNLGRNNIIDKKMWYLSKTPYNIDFYIELSKEYVKYIKACRGNKKKCIVLDLDNTLWGGILGEEGFNGIKLGNEYPGQCYKDFQLQLKNLKNRGLLLAINSKNNYKDAINVINNHPDMILREDDFASIKINWNDKASNLREIGDELNIGIESFVFIDDSPAECELIRQAFNEKVKVINLAKYPIYYVDIINRVNCFETLSITEEDKSKTNMYRSQIEREKLMESSFDLKSYYKSLNMVVTIDEANEFYVPRIAQLTQKTNQFNMTTRRYSENDIEKFLNAKEYKVFYMSVKDKFGDNGLVSVCIIKQEKNIWYIDTFLMSCRVMKRNLEIAFMSYIYEEAIKYKMDKLVGEYIVTEKNKAVSGFYNSVGFKLENEEYVFDLISESIKCPEYIKIVNRS